MLYRCYAKVNLTLEILGRRPDGYHDLVSLVHTIGLADDLRIDSADELLTRVEGLDIDPDTNLVSRAAELLAGATGTRYGAELSLVKRIPSAAGLGGGSSDAATTLVGLNTLWNTRLGPRRLLELAAELGSDVPYFVRGGAAIMRGRGELLERLPPINGQWFTILVPEHDILDKTRRLYAALEPADFTSGETTNGALTRWREGLPLAEDLLVNSFSGAARAVFSGLEDLWAQAEKRCERRFFLSGAGPALFALARDRADARRQASELGPNAFAARTVAHARASVKFAAATAIEYA